jgi:hypothetical protein
MTVEFDDNKCPSDKKFFDDPFCSVERFAVVVVVEDHFDLIGVDEVFLMFAVKTVSQYL